MSLFSELKRRNVFRVALLYLVGGWLMLQVTDVGVSLLGLPGWTGRLVFFILLIGLPLVILFSWAYEITPEGLKREREVERDASITAETARKLNAAVIVLLVLAIGGLIVDRLIPEHRAAVVKTADIEPAAPAPVERSIAVLPFVNMSADKDNEYFSDGLSEELLNLLAKIPDLQVAARTSAFTFKNVDADIGEIAAKLNVAHVLEGSVRKSGDDIRITAQLIKASDGYHLWSETWDRTLVDVFAIQDEIAAAVVDALKVTLLGEIPHARVTDPRAYELYLQSREAANTFSEEGFEQATALLTEALAIDPEYADAWTALGVVQTNQTGQGFVPAEIGFERARSSTERALKLNPADARAMSGLGWVAMYRDWDFAEAARLIGRARDLEPGNASVLNSYAVLNGVFGRRDAQLDLYEQALVKDPMAMSVLANLAGASLATDRQRTAELIERMRALEPESANIPLFSGWLQQFEGNAEIALEIFEQLGGINGAWGRSVALWDLGRDAESDSAIQELIELGVEPTRIAMAYAYRDEHDKAFEWLEKGFAERDDWLIEIRMFAPMQNLTDDPRWAELLARIGISDADAREVGF
jgi:TolB-like protein/Flp pilus assembly protein TadD